MSIGGWLTTLGLEECTGLFEREHIDLEAARHLTEANLKDLGLPMGHRAKLLVAVAALETAQAVPPGVGVGRSAGGRAQTDAEQGERRQLTVLFCDMVGFTELANRVDPEVPYYVNSAFWPSIDNLERALTFGRDEPPESRLDKLEALSEYTAL